MNRRIKNIGMTMIAVNIKGSQAVPSNDAVKTLPLFAALKWSDHISAQGAINIAPAKTSTASHAERVRRVNAQTLAGMPTRRTIASTHLISKLPSHLNKAA